MQSVVDDWQKASKTNGRRAYLRRHLQDDRRRQLFAVACCREVWDQVVDERSRSAVELSESITEARHAGQVTPNTRLDKAVLDAAYQAVNDLQSDTKMSLTVVGLEFIEGGQHFTIKPSMRLSNGFSSWSAASVASVLSAETAQHLSSHYAAEAARFAALSRFCTTPNGDPEAMGEMIGRQGRILASFVWRGVCGTWKTSNVVGLARAMYHRKDFTIAPYLADALQDAGCEDQDVLGMLRDASFPLYRGSALLDCLLT